MAQQARPKVIGHRLDLRAQLMTLSTVVKARLSPKRFWMSPPISVIRLAPVLGADPFEVPLAPHVHQRHHEDRDEHQALEVGEHAELPEDHRPRQEEDGLHVEDDEDEGEYVEADVELDPGRPHGVLAALVGGELLLAETGWPYHLPAEKVDAEEGDRDLEECEHR